MAIATSGRVELWYDIQGEGEPLVLTGGFGILHEQFHLVTPILAKHFKVINWNWRGAGRSDRAQTQDYSIELWTEDLHAVLDAAGINSAYLWSTSTGSLIGIHFTARYPERVRALITYPYFKTDLELRRVYQCYQHIFDVFGWDGITRILSWIGLPEERLNSEEGTAFAKWERECLERSLNPGSFNKMCQAYEYVDLTSDLPRLRSVPVLLLAGRDGPLGLGIPMIQRLASQFLEAVSSAKTHVIEGSGGTYCMLEKPEETAQAVINYLNSLAK
jgi:pimeloyl-ACP methyl ester carboxylesterase